MNEEADLHQARLYQSRGCGVACPECFRPLSTNRDCATCKATSWPSIDAYVAEIYAVVGLEGGYRLGHPRIG